MKNKGDELWPKSRKHSLVSVGWQLGESYNRYFNKVTSHLTSTSTCTFFVSGTCADIDKAIEAIQMRIKQPPPTASYWLGLLSEHQRQSKNITISFCHKHVPRYDSKYR